MKLCTILNVHDHKEVAEDTIDSILTYVGPNLLVVVDGAFWKQWKTLQQHKIEGFYHNCSKSPYRNVALGLKTAVEMWHTNTDWYLYLEYDTIITSDRFKVNLKFADDRDVWMLGNDGRVDNKNLSYLDPIIKLDNCYYLLGACQFLSKKLMNKLTEIDFFNRFLMLTNNFSEGYFPNYDGYDLSENIYPSLARHFKGNIGVFATWDKDKWHGAYEIFPVRWRPEITEIYPKSSILHPVKDMSNIRKYYKEKRCQGV